MKSPGPATRESTRAARKTQHSNKYFLKTWLKLLRMTLKDRISKWRNIYSRKYKKILQKSWESGILNQTWLSHLPAQRGRGPSPDCCSQDFHAPVPLSPSQEEQDFSAFLLWPQLPFAGNLSPRSVWSSGEGCLLPPRPYLQDGGSALDVSCWE